MTFLIHLAWMGFGGGVGALAGLVGVGRAKIPWAFPLFLLLLAALILWRAHLVKRSRHAHGLVAARTVGSARAASRTGALIAGACAAWGILHLGYTSAWAHQGVLLALASFFAALFLMASSLLAERWCRIPSSPAPRESTDKQVQQPSKLRGE